MTTCKILLLFSSICMLQIKNVAAVDCFVCHGNNAFPRCMNARIQCSHDEVCLFNQHHGSPKVKCERSTDCVADGSTTCCQDNACTDNTAAKLAGNHVTQIHTSTPTHPDSLCQDEITNGDDCNSLKPFGVCSDHIGIRVCPATCGLCPYLKLRFGNNKFCEDQLLDNECDHLKNSKNICADQLSKYTCPRTCNMCGDVLEGIIHDFMNNSSSWPGMTEKPRTTTTPKPCVDHMINNGCSSVPNICSDAIAATVCQKTCNLCGSSNVLVG